MEQTRISKLLMILPGTGKLKSIQTYFLVFNTHTRLESIWKIIIDYTWKPVFFFLNQIRIWMVENNAIRNEKHFEMDPWQV
jgi:hypothetical protein